MGNVLNGCVRCMQYCHDQRQEWKANKECSDNEFDVDGNYEYSASAGELRFRGHNGKSNHAQNKIYRGYQPAKLKTSSIFVAIQDKNTREVLRHLQEDEAGKVKSEVNSNHESPLHLACRMGYISIAKMLIQHGCPGNITTRLGTPMHSLIKAVKSRYISSDAALELLPHLLSSNCHIDGIDNKEQTALYHAVCQSNQDFVEWFITYGASTDLQDSSNGFTALHMATFVGHIGCLSTLLKAEDVPLDAVDCQGRTALVIALLDFLGHVQREVPPVYLTETYLDPVHKARYERMAIVEALLTAGANPNLTDSHGRNPMVIAHGLLALDVTKYGLTMNTRNSQPPSTDASVTAAMSTEQNSTPTESMFAPMVRLLVMFGGRFPIGHRQTSFMHYADWMQKLYEDSLGEPPEGGAVSRGPRTLVHSCRLFIRGHLGRIGKLNRITELPLPDKLLNYVLVAYI